MSNDTLGTFRLLVTGELFSPNYENIRHNFRLGDNLHTTHQEKINKDNGEADDTLFGKYSIERQYVYR